MWPNLQPANGGLELMFEIASRVQLLVLGEFGHEQDFRLCKAWTGETNCRYRFRVKFGVWTGKIDARRMSWMSRARFRRLLQLCYCQSGLT